MVAVAVNAQTCTGSLGDPIINETFGSGGGIGPALPTGVTNLQYVNNNCPNDGQYTIASSIGDCFEGTWFSLRSDHTGDANGYMMIVNANATPSVFYVQRVKGDKLCPNTTYEFAAYISNILRNLQSTEGDIQPNITFTIQSADGTLLAPRYNTGDIPTTADGHFTQYGTYFTSPSDGQDIVVMLSNNSAGGNGNDFAIDDITFKPCGPIIKAGFSTIGNTATPPLCQGASGSYSLVSSQSTYKNASYQWQQSINNSPWVDIAGEVDTAYNFALNNPPAGSYEYRVGVLEAGKTALSCRIYSAPLTITINPLPAINLSTFTYVCQDNVLTLNASGGDTYSWTGPNGFTSSMSNPVVNANATAASAGAYSVTVVSKGCPSFATTQVQVLPKVVAAVSNATEKICSGNTATLDASGSLNATYYSWSPADGLDNTNQAVVHAKPAQTTVYTLTAGNNGCFDDSKSITVTVLKNPVANAGSPKLVFNGKSIRLDGSATGDDVSYFWTPAAGLDDPTSLTPVASPADNTTYTLHVVSNYTCGESTSTVVVRVFKQLTIPNTFTPNNDGTNDFWYIKALNSIPESTVKIFDRYGQAVYQSNGYAIPWDGTRNNKPLPVGTYYYIINLKNNIPVLSGWVLIVR